MGKVRFNYEETRAFLNDLVHSDGLVLDLRSEREIVWRRPHAETETVFKLPLVYPDLQKGELLETYLERVPVDPDPYFLLLMRAGSAALGGVVDGELVEHKVIRKYMVRKKQGKAQVTYLKQKGKSRLGSRIRLAQSKEFFEEINEWLCTHVSDRTIVYYSCPVRLWPLVFASKTAPPFERESPRLIHIPHHIHLPNHDELQRVHTLVETGLLQED